MADTDSQDDQGQTTPIADTDVPVDAPIDWKIDLATGQVIFPITYVTGSAAVAQRLAITLRLFVGEYFLNRAAGTPWVENDVVSAADAILGQNFDQVKAEAALRRIAIGTLGVMRVDSVSVSFDPSTRDMIAALQIVSVYGDTLQITTRDILPS